MEDTAADVKAYYEEEARRRLRRPLVGRRVELRNEFLALLAAEGRRRIVDYGAGPGGDLDGFVAAGLDAVGLDLAVGNAALAAEAGLVVVPGSLAAPPFRSGAFDAGWSMSALMHLPEHEVEGAAAAMAATLEPGAPLLIGVWGGERRDEIDEERIAGQRRLFSLREAGHNAELIAAAGTIERTWFWDDPGISDEQDYQVFLVRVS